METTNNIILTLNNISGTKTVILEEVHTTISDGYAKHAYYSFSTKDLTSLQLFAQSIKYQNGLNFTIEVSNETHHLSCARLDKMDVVDNTLRMRFKADEIHITSFPYKEYKLNVLNLIKLYQDMLDRNKASGIKGTQPFAISGFVKEQKYTNDIVSDVYNSFPEGSAVIVSMGDRPQTYKCVTIAKDDDTNKLNGIIKDVIIIEDFSQYPKNVINLIIQKANKAPHVYPMIIGIN